MSKSKREKLKSFYGLHDVKSICDPNVMRRRTWHVAASVRFNESRLMLQLSSSLLAFVFLLLPSWSVGWNVYLSNIYLVGDFSHLMRTTSWWVFLYLFVCALLKYCIYWILRKSDYPGGWPFSKKWELPYSKLVVDLELYPVNVLEERIFWLNFALDVILSFVWVIFIWCLAFLFR